jgi:hypothetical protein
MKAPVFDFIPSPWGTGYVKEKLQIGAFNYSRAFT